MSNNDRFTVRAVVIFLGAGMLVGLAGLIWLVGRGGTDAALLGIIAGPTGTALGALGTLLARTTVEPVAPQPVTVENKPADPIPVTTRATPPSTVPIPPGPVQVMTPSP